MYISTAVLFQIINTLFNNPILGSATAFLSVISVFYRFLECRSEYQITCVTSNCSHILSPKEWPVVIIFEMVRITEQKAWSFIARYEREIGPVISIEHFLRTSGTNSCHKWIVVVWMTSEEPFSCFVFLDVWSELFLIVLSHVWCFSISVNVIIKWFR